MSLARAAAADLLGVPRLRHIRRPRCWKKAAQLCARSMRPFRFRVGLCTLASQCRRSVFGNRLGGSAFILRFLGSASLPNGSSTVVRLIVYCSASTLVPRAVIASGVLTNFARSRPLNYGSEGCVFESRRVQIKSKSRSAGHSAIQNLTQNFSGCHQGAAKNPLDRSFSGLTGSVERSTHHREREQERRPGPASGIRRYSRGFDSLHPLPISSQT
jgi:hypothetical protein